MNINGHNLRWLEVKPQHPTFKWCGFCPFLLFIMHLLLLHGAIGSAAQLQPLAEKLSQDFSVATLNFSGHGGNQMGAENYSIELFAEDVLRFMEEQGIKKVAIFGYSMGGYVALYLAKHYPQKVGQVFTLATKFNWSPEVAEKEVKMLDPVAISQKLPRFAEILKNRHSPANWETVLYKTAQMLQELGRNNVLTKADLNTLSLPVIFCVGDSDKMVAVEETLAIQRQVKDSGLLVLPLTPHPIEAVDLQLLVVHLRSFFTQVSVSEKSLKRQ